MTKIGGNKFQRGHVIYIGKIYTVKTSLAQSPQYAKYIFRNITCGIFYCFLHG